MKINNFRTSIAAFVLGSSTFAVGMFSFSAPAQAWFKVCNKSTETLTLAFAFRKEGSWISKGWWNIESGVCSTLSDEPLERNLYVYALNGSLGLRGDREFCVRRQSFRIVNATQCEDHGKLVGFQKIDIGGNENYTLNLRPNRD
jgi:uncharacterized membrane protein